MKLVVDRATQRVVGAHMVGPDAGEVIQGIAIAVKLGATKAQFDATIGIHPDGCGGVRHPAGEGWRDAAVEARVERTLNRAQGGAPPCRSPSSCGTASAMRFPTAPRSR